MCNWVLQNNQESPFCLFVYLKLSYPSGKIQWIHQDKEYASFFLKKCSKTITNNFNKLIALGWLYYDEEFEYYRLVSIDTLRDERDWTQRRAAPFTYKDVTHIRAALGAILYTQLYKSYCRKHFKKRKSNVLKSESASESFTFSCDVKRFAEISVNSIESIFGLSINKASRIKNLAAKENLLEVQKQYFELTQEQVYAAKKGAKYRGENQNIIFKNGKHYLQLTDKIYSDLYFKKRKKLETL
ncbi:hypothetical protein LPB03_06440 [Polaribacter vadi]|uniref:Uncharacterized protein n=1 Tax=Polaribacter vadi TaxID=1774273 RepID=A0A1B8TZF7_9FLAO|nr:hypothetical protein LPB03_06440 [Polaribacter vadi]OBY64954.1 hypothetical protein LPB3_06050 [Polaribacter vadi]